MPKPDRISDHVADELLALNDVDCTGAILLYGIPRVVIGENQSFKDGDDLLRSRGVEVTIIDDAECRTLMGKFMKENPEICSEGIGAPDA